MSYSEADTISRFFIKSDEKQQEFVFELPDSWWSRIYEYVWVSKFVNKEDVVLDAACGISHPFKFFLAEQAKSLFACDYDQRILNIEKIKLEILEVIGFENYTKFIKNKAFLFDKIFYSHCSITNIPLEEKTFDKIFCVSVLEEMKKDDMFLALQEFVRLIKDDGFIIITFDYPLIDLNFLQKCLKDLKLKFYSSVDFELPDDALYSNFYRYYCFRALLVKDL